MQFSGSCVRLADFLVFDGINVLEVQRSGLQWSLSQHGLQYQYWSALLTVPEMLCCWQQAPWFPAGAGRAQRGPRSTGPHTKRGPRSDGSRFTRSVVRGTPQKALPAVRGTPQSAQSAVRDSQPARGPASQPGSQLPSQPACVRCSPGLRPLASQTHCALRMGTLCMASDKLCMVFWPYGSRHTVHGIPAI